MRVTGPNSLGQHTLKDRQVIDQMIREAKLTRIEKVLEIGAGEGTLTAHLCRNATQVTSVEIDKAKFELVRQKLARYSNLLLLNTNPYTSKPPGFEFDVCVSNIPYSRSKETVMWLADYDFSRAILMVQKEFARKLSSIPGDRAYRAISVICRYHFNVEELFEVPSTAFEPQPTVSSQVIKLTPSGRKLSKVARKNVAILFSQKRRNLRKVASYFGLESNLDLSKRICQLSPYEVVDLATRMSV